MKADCITFLSVMLDKAVSDDNRGSTTVEKTRQRAALNSFFASVERRALKIAEIGTGNRDDALDLVQDAMLRLAGRYAERPENEWPPLFHRILQSRIQDWHRKSQVRRKIFAWLPGFDVEVDAVQQLVDPQAITMDRQLDSEHLGLQVEQALQALPLRQRQAFLLRCWEGLDVNETAAAMRCSAGSVKTHYSRALQALQRRLAAYRMSIEENI